MNLSYASLPQFPPEASLPFTEFNTGVKYSYQIEITDSYDNAMFVLPHFPELAVKYIHGEKTNPSIILEISGHNIMISNRDKTTLEKEEISRRLRLGSFEYFFSGESKATGASRGIGVSGEDDKIFLSFSVERYPVEPNLVR